MKKRSLFKEIVYPKKQKYTKRNWNTYLKENNLSSGEDNINIKQNKKFFSNINSESYQNNKDDKDSKNITPQFKYNILKENTNLDYNDKAEDNYINIRKADNGILNEQISFENISNKKNEENTKENNIILYQYIYDNILNLSIDDNSNKDDSGESEIEEDISVYDKSKKLNNHIISNLSKEINNKSDVDKIQFEKNNDNLNKKENTIENNNILSHKTSNISNNIVVVNDEEILFNNRKYKLFTRTKYIKKDKIKRLIYKCENLKKNERNCNKYKHSAFCNSKIEYIYPEQGVKSGYFIKKEHSLDCDNLYKKSYDNNLKDNNKEVLTNKKNNDDKISFIEKCENLMNNSSIYDRRLFKNEFKNIYNENKYSFEINDNFLSNIISKWRSKTDRFNKTTVLNNVYDYNNNQILREYRTLYIQIGNKSKPKKLEYIIWINNENLNRFRKSKYIFIDFTFHTPPEFS